MAENVSFLLMNILLAWIYKRFVISHFELTYFFQVIRQFEQFCMPDMVISLANTAISIADDDDPNVVSL